MEFAHNQLPGSLELAYLGDSIYELYVREALIRRGGRVKELHKRAVSCVNAAAQARALSKIEDGLSEDELAVVRRARNARQTPTKGADIADYHKATALEALIGYWHVTGNKARIDRVLIPLIEEALGDDARK